MGGHAAGEIASEKAVETIRNFIDSFQSREDFTWPFGVDADLSPQVNLMVTAVKLANRTVCKLAQEKPEYSGMGTTIVACLIEERNAAIVHVGDSRAYLLRDGKLNVVTEDHSWVQEQIREQLLTEEEARNHRWRNVITRALGNRYEVEVDWQVVELEPGDTLLLCTDGLSGSVAEERIAALLSQAEEDAQVTCDLLIEEANRGGGPDNITTVLIHADPGP
jgi:protein phosphatase